jgi:hypothetical protein
VPLEVLLFLLIVLLDFGINVCFELYRGFGIFTTQLFNFSFLIRGLNVMHLYNGVVVDDVIFHFFKKNNVIGIYCIIICNHIINYFTYFKKSLLKIHTYYKL